MYSQNQFFNLLSKHYPHHNKFIMKPFKLVWVNPWDFPVWTSFLDPFIMNNKCYQISRFITGCKYVGKGYPQNQLKVPKHLIDSTVNTSFQKKYSYGFVL